MAKKRLPKGTGKVRQLPSGRWQAKTRDADGNYWPAPSTFDTKLDGVAWLQAQQKAQDLGTWEPPTGDDSPTPSRGKMPTLAEYADSWLASRQLKPRTAQEYRGLLRRNILPELGGERLDRITATAVRQWYATCAPGQPSTQHKAYALLRTIYATAVTDELVSKSPCRVAGADSGRAAKRQIVVLDSPTQVADLMDALPDHLRAAVVFGCWTALRQGEVLALTRDSIDVERGRVHVRGSAYWVAGGPPRVGTTKTQDHRTVALPPHVLPIVVEHLEQHTGPGPDALLFAARTDERVPMSASTFFKQWKKARAAIGRPDLRFHDLRHSGATWAAQSGSTLKELMDRLGHRTPDMALRYQHAAADRDAQVAEALSRMAEADTNVVSLDARRAK